MSRGKADNGLIDYILVSQNMASASGGSECRLDSDRIVDDIITLSAVICDTELCLDRT
jgi:hypothetical protein